ncbi:MAG: MFS transporter [Planctomycetota bacterium]|jgi:nucleoside transporter
MDKPSTSIRIRLSVMMFLQYMMFAVWWVPLAAYLTTLEVSPTYKAWILSVMPLGCLLAPVFCMVADRHFASQKVLTVLNFGCAVLFFFGAQQTNAPALFVILLLGMFLYMPTWSLTNAIAMSNYPSEKFPQIRVFGSIGWVASGVFGLVAATSIFKDKVIDGTAIPLYCGAGTALVAAILNLTLPNTPPPAKGKEASIVDALGLRALTLLKNLNFALFIIVSLLVMIPFTLYFSLGSQFFKSEGFEQVTATMNLGQLVEIFLMLLVPLALTKFGVKWTMVAGLGALAIRYLALWGGVAADQIFLYYVAILVHGAIFGFFFVGGQVYVDKKAPAEIRAQAQGLIVLICFGIGMLIGTFFNVRVIESYTAESELVAAGYSIPKTPPSERSTVASINLSTVSMYDRALSDDEISTLNARDFEKDDEAVQEITNEAAEPVNLTKGLLASGDSLVALAGAAPQTGLTFSAVLSLPEGDTPVSGNLFTIGEGDDGIVLGVEEDKLFWQAGASTISQKLPLTRGNDDDGNPNKIHVAASYDGELIKLYVNGNLYKRVNWNPVFVIATIISVILLAALCALFRDDVTKAEKPASIEQESESAD